MDIPQTALPVKTPNPYATPANTKQIGGDHYKQFNNIQPWDAIIDWNLNFFTGNALKYIARYPHKGGITDLKKAIHYLEKEIERLNAISPPISK